MKRDDNEEESKVKIEKGYHKNIDNKDKRSRIPHDTPLGKVLSNKNWEGINHPMMDNG